MVSSGLDSRGIIDGKKAQAVQAAVGAVKALVGLENVHYSVRAVMRPGTEEVDRVELLLTIR